jgi:adenylate cyclase
MENQQDQTLVKRIAKLVEENKTLMSQLKQVSVINDDLTDQVEKLKHKLSKLKDEGSAHTETKESTLKFKMATVLFIEMEGFKDVSEEHDSNEIIDELDNLYITFETIVEKYKIQQIKTIGDNFMCAGGVPHKNSTNPVDVVLAALEMMHHFLQVKQKYLDQKKSFYYITMGIHTGPVIATTSGKKKISYDIKGETVNIASRMKSICEPDKINISIMTYELIKEYFTCEYNGKIPVKMQGNLEMYTVRRIKLAYSENRQGVKTNDIFKIKYLLRQFGDLQETILDKLEKELPPFLFYHNYKHTIDVVTQAELIAWGEGIPDDEILLLKTAALFHDTGQIYGSKDHEEKSCDIAKEYLPDYGYNEEQINKTCELIMATKLPPQPKTLIEQIMCDSDLDYLGRSDFIPISNSLFDELKAQNILTDLNEWNKLQVKFLSNHQFFTKTANNLREVNKQQQIERIKKLIN